MTSPGQIDIGRPPHPTDREREIALQIGRAIDMAPSRADLLTAIARSVAHYRVELEQRGAREASYALVESDMRDRRVSSVRIAGSIVSAERINHADDTVVRCPSYSLRSAVEGLGSPEVSA